MELLQEQLNAKRAGIPHAVLTVAETKGTSPCKVGKKMLLLEDGRTFGTIGGGAMELQALQEAAQAVKDGESYLKRYVHVPTYEEPGLGCSFEVSVLVEVSGPGLTLAVCGAGHVGSAALKFGRLLNFQTILLDSRPVDQIEETIALADRFISCETFEAGILNGNIPKGAYYLCCAPTHSQDKSALKGALQQQFAYVGMLGSVKKTVELYGQLEQEGIERELLNQVHTPVGLDICDMSPEEVAFSVLAEMLMVKNGGTGRSRKELKTPKTPKREI